MHTQPEFWPPSDPPARRTTYGRSSTWWNAQDQRLRNFLDQHPIENIKVVELQQELNQQELNTSEFSRHDISPDALRELCRLHGYVVEGGVVSTPC